MTAEKISEAAVGAFIFEYAKRTSYKWFFLPDVRAAFEAALSHLAVIKPTLENSPFDALIAERDAELAEVVAENSRLMNGALDIAEQNAKLLARIKTLEEALGRIARLDGLSGGYGDMARAALEAASREGK